MRLIDADKAKEQIRQMQTLKPSEKALLHLGLDRTPTYEPPNPPLTLEELREMVQSCEGIYVANVDGSPVFRDQTHCAAVLDVSPAFGSAVRHIHAIYGDRLTLWEEEYGVTWLAYSRKPESEEQQ